MDLNYHYYKIKKKLLIFTFFCGPLVFYIILSFIEKVRIKKVNFYKIKVNGELFCNFNISYISFIKNNYLQENRNKIVRSKFFNAR